MLKTTLLSCLALTTALVACAKTQTKTESANTQTSIPAETFDLSHWNITVPTDVDNNGKVDTVSVADIQSYSHPDFFYLAENGDLVFASPNKALTTPNSSNTRSELRYMSRGSDTSIKTKAPGNNFALAAHPNASEFAAIGGKLEATLRVDHVAINAGDPDTKAAYSAVVGQIHGVKVDDNSDSFGYGNEPLKIYFKKFPGHEMGSIFWNHERNLAKEHPNRTDISYAVFGNNWDDTSDPGDAGIALGEEFSYVVNVHDNTMYLTFTTKRHGTVEHAINLADNVDAKGNVDSKDNPAGYTGDALYFKAGIYNQCSTKTGGGLWYAGCPGTGDWAIDKANGDYAQSSFSRLVVGPSTPQ